MGGQDRAPCTCSTRAGTTLRDQIFANQKKLGVIPQNAKLTPWPDDLLKRWDTLSDDEKKLFIRQADVYAAYLAYTDHEIGRVIQAVEDMGKLDNTLIIYISGDNGSSAEGTLNGTPNEVAHVQRRRRAGRRAAEVLLRRLGHRTRPTTTWRCRGPGPSTRRSQWTKQIASHFGGTRQGMAISWPAHDQGQGRHPQPVPPRHRRRADHPGGHRHRGSRTMVDGIAQSPIEGVSMAYTFDKANAAAPSTRTHAVFRDDGRPRHLPRRLDRQHQGRCARPGSMPARHRSRPDNGYPVGALRPRATTGRSPTTWPPSNPDKLKELQDLFWQEADEVPGLPLDASVATAPGHAAPEHHGRPQRLHLDRRRSPARRNGDAPSLLNASYTITAEIDVPQGGGDGMLITQGGRFGGYGFYLLKGKPVFPGTSSTSSACKLGGAGRARAGQAHAGVRLQV